MNINKNEVYSKAELLINEIIKVLDIQCDLLKSSGYGEQKVKTFQQTILRNISLYYGLQIMLVYLLMI